MWPRRVIVSGLIAPDTGTLSDVADTPESTVFVLFGATGDLAKRLVLPSFYRLAQEGLLPAQWRLIGNGRRQKTDDEFRNEVRAALDEFGSGTDDDTWSSFSECLLFAGNGFSVDDAGELPDRLAEVRGELGQDVQLVHYIGLPPSVFQEYTRAIGAHDLAEGSRVVYEKPFGTSLESFRELDTVVHDVLDESQVYRIDHFLGKEAAQQLRAVRFANGLFARSWDREHVAAVQIDVPETLNVDDRAEFYDATGAILDMLVTHLFQVAAEVAMEPPASFSADDIAEARTDAVRHFRTLDPSEVVVGQYEGYRTLKEVADDSRTETFVAARLWIDSDRWRDVPFLLRTGKEMAESHQKVSLVFRAPDDGPVEELPELANVLTFDLAGNGALSFALTLERPGAEEALERAVTNLPLETVSGGDPLPPYARLLHDVLIGDRTLFTRPDGLEDVWTTAAPILDAHPEPEPYATGSWGPDAAIALAEPVGWALPR